MFQRKSPPMATAAKADWYPAPDRAGQWRYWDGQQWTHHYAPMTVVGPVHDQTAVFYQPPLHSGGSAPVGSQAAPLASPGSNPGVLEIYASLRPDPTLRVLEEQIEVAGETYHVKAIRRLFADHHMNIAQTGSTIESIGCALVPEPWNPHDSNAVAVVVGGHHVGYVPAELAPLYASPLGLLANQRLLVTGEARVWAKADGAMIRARVTVLVPEAASI